VRPAVVAAPALAAIVGLAAGCGGSGSGNAYRTTAPGAPTTSARSTTTTANTTTTSGTSGGPGALQAEANSTAAGDIPDNQVFLVFADRPAGYSMKYPEGWAQQGAGNRVTFRDKNNIVRVVVAPGAAPTRSSVQSDVARLRDAGSSGAPQSLTIGGKPAFKVVYSTVSAPNAVTGKRVKLVVDRYYLAHGGKRAVVDLGTPEGVDNVDAYRLMIESFRWK
jgi:hypothetical protein